MLSHITWGQYWSVLIILVAIYYFFIAIIFYRKEISGLLRAKISHHRSGENGQTEEHRENGHSIGFDGLESVVTDIKAVMLKAGTDAEKEPLLAQLKLRITAYDGIRQPAFRNAINQYIVRNA
jgi:hypothetical protein